MFSLLAAKNVHILLLLAALCCWSGVKGVLEAVGGAVWPIRVFCKVPSAAPPTPTML